MHERLLPALLAICAAFASARAAPAATIQLQRDDAKHALAVVVDGKKALEYHYAPDEFLPYIHPLRSPSGKDLLVRLTRPYPHHRSFWIADTVQLAGHPAASFYHDAYYKKNHRIRHDRFLEAKVAGGAATLKMQLLWELGKKTPALKETRHLRLVPLGKGEYFIDLRFQVGADYGDVRFVSDWVHYAWPYLRMHPQFSVQKGGKIVNSEGGVNQAGTNAKVAKWVDYSNTVDGATEGLAVFSHTENEHPHKWLTRNYGTFGPRRIDAKSGNRSFVLKQGERLTMRVGVLVHRGDVEGGRVAERYQQYIRGELSRLEEDP